MPGRRGELKYVDVPSGLVFTEAGAVLLLNGLAPGTGASQRIGKKIVNKSIQYRLSLDAGSAGATIFRGFVRMLIVYDKQSNATAPTVAQILEQVAGSSHMNMDNRDRFTVLSDKQFALDQSGGHQSGQTKMYKKLSLPTIFNAGTAGTVADITSGSIYLLYISENSAGSATNTPLGTFTSRIRFDDS